MKFFRYSIVFVLIIAVVAVMQFKKWVVENGPLSDSVMVEINRGVSSQRVADILYKQGVINHPLLFRLLMKYQKAEEKIKAGEYLFEQKISAQEALNKLVKGDVFYYKITVPEGYTVAQIIELLNTNDKLSGEVSSVLPEGSFLPETYTFQKGERRDNILNKAVSAMQEKLAAIWEGREEGLPYKNMQELLTMASIIEKETGIDSERAQVASVFVNRLRKGMLLQTDPTVIYALTKGQSELGRALLRKDLAVDDPYNTYRYAGLPPTPICNPGETSLYAAAHPAPTDYLYFVANGSGGHNFAKTLSEHNRNVADWKKNNR